MAIDDARFQPAYATIEPMKARIPAILEPDSIDVVSHGPAHTVRIGQQIGAALTAGDLVLLFGTFGVGKTHLTKGIASAFGIPEADVTSPTFVLVNNYTADKTHGRTRIHHIDLYRLEGNAKDFDSIGLEELWDDSAICVIEWAERVSDSLPSEYLEIRIDHLAETKRMMRLKPYGERYKQLIQRLRGK